MVVFYSCWSILTPHPREFDRMAGNSVNTFERMEKAIELARLNDIIIVLKDAFTRIIFLMAGCISKIPGIRVWLPGQW